MSDRICIDLITRIRADDDTLIEYCEHVFMIKFGRGTVSFIAKHNNQSWAELAAACITSEQYELKCETNLGLATFTIDKFGKLHINISTSLHKLEVLDINTGAAKSYARLFARAWQNTHTLQLNTKNK